MPSFTVIKPSPRPEQPSATFASLPGEIMRMIVLELKNDMYSGIRLARADPAYEFDVAKVIFSEYRAKKTQDLALFLQAINETPSLAQFTTKIVLNLTLDGQANSGVYAMFTAIATGKVQTTSALLRTIAGAVSESTVGHYHGYTHLPQWLQNICFYYLIVNAVPTVKHVVMPSEWSIGGQHALAIYFPNLETLRLT